MEETRWQSPDCSLITSKPESSGSNKTLLEEQQQRKAKEDAPSCPRQMDSGGRASHRSPSFRVSCRRRGFSALHPPRWRSSPADSRNYSVASTPRQSPPMPPPGTPGSGAPAGRSPAGRDASAPTPRRPPEGHPAPARSTPRRPTPACWTPQHPWPPIPSSDRRTPDSKPNKSPPVAELL